MSEDRPKRRLISYVFGFFSNTIAFMLIVTTLAITGWCYLRVEDFVQYGEDFVQSCETVQVAQLEGSRALAIAEMEAHSRKDLEQRLRRAAEICIRLKVSADDAKMEAEQYKAAALFIAMYASELVQYIEENGLPVPAPPQLPATAPEPGPFIPFGEETCPDESSSNSQRPTTQPQNAHPTLPDGSYPRSWMAPDAFGTGVYPEVFQQTPFPGPAL